MNYRLTAARRTRLSHRAALSTKKPGDFHTEFAHCSITIDTHVPIRRLKPSSNWRPSAGGVSTVPRLAQSCDCRYGCVRRPPAACGERSVNSVKVPVCVCMLVPVYFFRILLANFAWLLYCASGYLWLTPEGVCTCDSIFVMVSVKSLFVWLWS